MTRIHSLIVLAPFVVAAGACSIPPRSFEDYPCEPDGSCAEGFYCHPQLDLCVSGDCTLGEASACASCTDDCAGTVLNAIPACDTTGEVNVCAFESCASGFENADGDDANGCECRVTNGGVDLPCNGVDEDCDGDDLSEIGTLNNCASCGDDCDGLANTTAVHCDVGGSPACAIDSCLSGFIDADGEVGNGCETACVATGSEACDGIDNDCNGVTDDMTAGAIAADCASQIPGANVAGWSCAGGCAVVACNVDFYDHDGLATTGCEYGCSPTPMPNEVCDGDDNDCDGSVDNVPDVDGDCVGQHGGAVDVSAWSCDVGVCAVAGCNSGRTDADQDPANGCEAACNATVPPDEVCDGDDNDCNGIVDDVPAAAIDATCAAILPLAGSVAAWECLAATCAIGACDLNNWDADGDPVNGCELACVPTTPPGETCDGIDNDCDGSLDSADTDLDDIGELAADCLGQFPLATSVAEWSCAGSCAVANCAGNFYNLDNDPSDGCEYACNPAVPGPEICDAEDNDCDGDLDTADADLNVATDCAARICTSSCGQVSGWACAAGACAITGCIADDYDADIDPVTGCEYHCTPAAPGAELCDGEDNDCDGDLDTADADLNPDFDCSTRVCASNCGQVAVWACAAGACGVSSCTADNYDDDDDPVTGCEYACAPAAAGADLCDGEDNDCDTSTVDGQGEATFNDPCDGADAGVCDEGLLACNGTALYCTDTTGDDIEGPFATPSCVDTQDNDCDTIVDLTDSDCDSGYGYRRPITVAASGIAGTCGAALTSFPLLVVLSGDNAVRTVPNGGRLQNGNGYDLTFWGMADSLCGGASTAPCALDHEIELWNGLTGGLVAWIRIPVLAHNAASTIYMYYGRAGVSASPENAAGVWDSDYVAVWHLGETVGGANAIRDSTANNNHATDVSSPILGAAGRVGRAVHLDGASNYLQVSDAVSLHLATSVTFEAWFYPDISKAWATLVSKFGSGTNAHLYWVQHDAELYYAMAPTIPNDGNYTIPIGIAAWSYAASTYDGAAGNYYDDATVGDTAAGTGALSLGTNTNDLFIGHNTGWTNEKFDGLIDEVRISRIARSACWIQTTYASQNAPATFAAWGGEQAL